MVIDEPWYEPASNSTQDLEAAERINLMTVSRLNVPIIVYYF